MPVEGYRRSLVSFGFFLILYTFALPVFSDVAAKQNELSHVLKQIKKTFKDTKLLQKQREQLIGKLASIEKKIGAIARDFNGIQKTIRKQQQQLQDVRNKISVQKTLLKKTTFQLQAQIRSAYAMGRMKKLKLFLNQQDPVRINRVLVYYDYLNRERLGKLKLTKQAILDLTRLEDEQQIAMHNLQQLAEQKRIKQAKLKSTRRTRAVLLAALKKKQLSKQEKLTLLKRKESKIRKLLASLQEHKNTADESFFVASSKPFAAQKGRLIWPVQGKLARKFGSSRGSSKWDGVLIHAQEGGEVRSVANGRVVYADWLKGYGLLVIIDHGKGYMTLYAFNQSLYKMVDERVEQGEVIATVGKSGGRNSVGLYFAIRKKGKPLNPVRWCRKVRRGK